MSDYQSGIGSSKSGALQQLISKYKSGATSALKKPGQATDELTRLAIQRRSDTVKFTSFMLKNKLVQDLDATLETQFRQHPQLRGKVYLGILVDSDYAAEVVPLDAAAKSVEGLEETEARQHLEKNPVGYFNKENFTLKTPDDPAFQEFKKGIEEYFQKNSEIFDYLRLNPEQDLSAEDFYNDPKSRGR